LDGDAERGALLVSNNLKRIFLR
jgi:hypothetical protein